MEWSRFRCHFFNKKRKRNTRKTGLPRNTSKNQSRFSSITVIISWHVQTAHAGLLVIEMLHNLETGTFYYAKFDCSSKYTFSSHALVQVFCQGAKNWANVCMQFNRIHLYAQLLYLIDVKSTTERENILLHKKWLKFSKNNAQRCFVIEKLRKIKIFW